MGLRYNTTVVRNGLLCYLDAANTKSYPGTGTSWNDLTGNQNFTEYDSGSFVSHNSSGYFDINRSTTASSEGGGGFTADASGSLSAPTFLYNPHTISVWCRINDRQPFYYYDNTATTEQTCTIISWRGYHAGLTYNNGQIMYRVWNGTSGTDGVNLAWTNSGVNEGEWFNVVARRDSLSNFEMLINNQSVAGPTTVNASSTGIGISNNIRIGHSATIGGNYSYSSDIDVSVVMLYSFDLSDEQVSTNWNAMRGRYGL